MTADELIKSRKSQKSTPRDLSDQILVEFLTRAGHWLPPELKNGHKIVKNDFFQNLSTEAREKPYLKFPLPEYLREIRKLRGGGGLKILFKHYHILIYTYLTVAGGFAALAATPPGDPTHDSPPRVSARDPPLRSGPRASTLASAALAYAIIFLSLAYAFSKGLRKII